MQKTRRAAWTSQSPRLKVAGEERAAFAGLCPRKSGGAQGRVLARVRRVGTQGKEVLLLRGMPGGGQHPRVSVSFSLALVAPSWPHSCPSPGLGVLHTEGGSGFPGDSQQGLEVGCPSGCRAGGAVGGKGGDHTLNRHKSLRCSAAKKPFAHHNKGRVRLTRRGISMGFLAPA